MNQSPTKQPFDSIQSAIQAIAQGEMIIVTDDQSRENEGDFVMAASKITPKAINMMIKHGRGLICTPVLENQLKRLKINPMVYENQETHRTDFTVSIDAAKGITTGISAYDRATTIKVLANPKSTSNRLVQPGHVFPLRAKPGGVLERAGHTEAAVDIASLAGLHPSGVICEILNEDGTCSRLPELIKMKKKFGLKMISIADLITYRHKNECLVERVVSQSVLSSYGTFDLHLFRYFFDKRQYIALTMGELDSMPTLVRVHSENLLNDVFQVGNTSLIKAIKKITSEQHGVLLYMPQPDRGIHLQTIRTNTKINTEEELNIRDYGIGAQILTQLGLKKIRLLYRTKRNLVALDGYGLEIVEGITLT
jgi:3,4-dihydroxy 2-butanone 4-phosphate synthase / GTP cyclohydrolase II